MTQLYSDRDLYEAYRQKRKLLFGLLFATALWLVGFSVCIALYVMLPYNDPNGTWYTVAACVWTGLYLLFCFPYLGISYKRCRAYYKMLTYISVGLKEYFVAPFAYVDDWTTHDGVDVNVAVFTVRGVKRDEEMKRQIFVDGEKDFPPFEEGDHVRMITHGNLLIAYEIDRKPQDGEGCE